MTSRKPADDSKKYGRLRAAAVFFCLFVQVSPVGAAPDKGPYAHRVESASSLDGFEWKRDRQVVAEHASVPCATVDLDGRILVYYVDASKLPETINASISVDGGKSWRVADVKILGLSGSKAVDPSVVRLPDGRYRLYYFGVRGEIDEQGAHSIYSAISDDGVRFMQEGEVFRWRGLVDPDVFWTGHDWMMYVFSLSELATIIARSADGQSFHYEKTLPLPGWGTVAPVPVPGNRFRLFAFRQPASDSFVSFVSDDLVRWKQEEGVRLFVEGGERVTDPFPVHLPDGTWKMYFKVEPAREPEAPKNPSVWTPLDVE